MRGAAAAARTRCRPHAPADETVQKLKALIRPSSCHDVFCVDWGLTACVDGPEPCQCWATFSYIASTLTRRHVDLDNTPPNTPFLSQ